MSYILQALKKEEADSDPQAAARLALTEQSAGRPWALWGIGAALLINAGVLGYLFFPDLQSAPFIAGTPPPPAAQGSKATGRAATPPISTPGASREVTVRPRSRVAPPGQAPASSTLSSQVTQRASERAPPNVAQTARQTDSTPEPAAELAAIGNEITIGPSSPPAAPERGGGRVLSPAEAEALNLIPAGSATADATAANPEAALANRSPAPAARPAKRQQSEVILLAELPPADRQSFPKLEFSTHIFADDPALRAVVVNSKRLNEGESIGEMVLRAVTEDGILVDYRGYRVAVSVIEEWN